ncbi:MAG: APC family permease [Candidatus Helarchaeota archaeon]
MTEKVEFKKALGFLQLSMIGIGAMIGAGIFILSSFAIILSGPSAIFAYLILGILSILTGFCYIELGTTIPKAGGGYSYAEELKGGFYGFITGWFLLIGNAAAVSVYAIGFSDALLTALGAVYSASAEFFASIVAIIVIVVFAFVNYRGISETSNIEVFLTTIKIFILIFVICFGIFIPKILLFPRGSFPINFTNFIPSFNNILPFIQTLAIIYISFFGFQIINTVAEEMKNPKKDMKKSIIITIVLSTLIYFGTIYTILIVTGQFQTKLIYDLTGSHGIVLSNTAETLLPGIGGVLINSATIATIASAINATLCANSRIIYAFGRDAYFPRIFGVLHRKRQSPHYAIVVCTIFSVVFASFGAIERVAIIADVGYLFGVGLVCLCVFELRKKEAKYEIHNKTPLYPIIPIIAFGANMALIPFFATVHVDMIFLTAIVVAIGVIFYLLRSHGVFKSRNIKRFIKFVKRQKI